MDRITGQRQHLKDRAGSVQIDVVVGRTNQAAEIGGDLLGDGAVVTAGTSASEILFVFGRASPAGKGRLVDDGDEGELAAKFCGVKFFDQATDGDHRLEFVAMDAAGDKQVGTGVSAGDGAEGEHEESGIRSQVLNRKRRGRAKRNGKFICVGFRSGLRLRPIRRR